MIAFNKQKKNDILTESIVGPTWEVRSCLIGPPVLNSLLGVIIQNPIESLLTHPWTPLSLLSHEYKYLSSTYAHVYMSTCTKITINSFIYIYMFVKNWIARLFDFNLSFEFGISGIFQENGFLVSKRFARFTILGHRHESLSFIRHGHVVKSNRINKNVIYDTKCM